MRHARALELSPEPDNAVAWIVADCMVIDSLYIRGSYKDIIFSYLGRYKKN